MPLLAKTYPTEGAPQIRPTNQQNIIGIPIVLTTPFVVYHGPLGLLIGLHFDFFSKVSILELPQQEAPETKSCTLPYIGSLLSHCSHLSARKEASWSGSIRTFGWYRRLVGELHKTGIEPLIWTCEVTLLSSWSSDCSARFGERHIATR